jgi:hypothetical protein
MQQELLKRFIQDEQLSNAVFEFIRDYFLQQGDSMDFSILAGERLAQIQLLQVWKELEKLKNNHSQSTAELPNIGL